MRPRRDSMAEYILFGILLLPVLYLAAALAQVTEETEGLAALISGLSELMSDPLSLRWCASTGKFLTIILFVYPVAVACYWQDKADRHPGAEHGTAGDGAAASGASHRFPCRVLYRRHDRCGARGLPRRQ